MNSLLLVVNTFAEESSFSEVATTKLLISFAVVAMLLFIRNTRNRSLER